MPVQHHRLRETEARAPRHRARGAQIISLNDRRALRDAQIQCAHVSASLHAGNVWSAVAAFALLALLWPVAKVAGVFAWSDCDERE